LEFAAARDGTPVTVEVSDPQPDGPAWFNDEDGLSASCSPLRYPSSFGMSRERSVPCVADQSGFQRSFTILLSLLNIWH
jgi:hypothetical protein